ncbi:MAG TPA: hypothetical protein VFW33_02960 [Gemmataceae bacterium]|nr:hypothetical protein [Gemmataceae bacterium]
MSVRTLRCAIEQVIAWHSRLYVEPHAAAFVAVAGWYSRPPARFEVECEGITSPWLRGGTGFRMEVDWGEATVDKAERLRATMQQKPLVELAALAVAFLLARRVLKVGRLEVSEYWERADYLLPGAEHVLEASGTEVPGDLGRRHREKAAQAQSNPFGWPAYVVVCAFQDEPHRVRLSHHHHKGASRGEG